MCSTRIDHFRFTEELPCDTPTTWGSADRLRAMHRIKQLGYTIVPRGGYTVAQIFSDEGNLIGYGAAVCSPQDNFCKRVGRKIAEQRAVYSARATLAQQNGQAIAL
jgi:hypothetical protein